MTIKDNLLALLSGGQGTYFSGEELARRFCVSRAAIWKAVQALRQEGYPIEAVNNRGYRLAAGTDVLSEAGVRKYLHGAGLRAAPEVLARADSTNVLLRTRAAAGAPEGLALLAGEQTAGRGRMGRAFFSPRGTGVYMSVLLRPKDTQRAQLLTAMAAAAMCEAIETVFGESAGVKWVNDIFVHGKKVCGILTEGAFSLESGVPEYIVLGAGVNVCLPEGGFPAELRDTAGAICDRPVQDGKNRLAAEFLNRFLTFYDAPEDSGWTEEYRRRSLAIGRDVTVLSGAAPRRAHALNVDDRCRLLVRYADSGETAALSYGEIRIRL